MPASNTVWLAPLDPVIRIYPRPDEHQIHALSGGTAPDGSCILACIQAEAQGGGSSGQSTGSWPAREETIPIGTTGIGTPQSININKG